LPSHPKDGGVFIPSECAAVHPDVDDAKRTIEEET
jgi:hypothetical protein